jgi:nucleotide-binding universal stress UspA family protein
VVVAVDGSEGSARALEWAGAEADLHDVPLLVVHAWEYPYVYLETSHAEARDLTRVDAACLLDAAVESARERCRVAVTGELVEGSASSAVLGAVRDGDLLTLSSRGHGALRSGIFGSTVNAVLDHAAVPTVVVR